MKALCVAKLYPTFSDLLDCSMLGFPAFTNSWSLLKFMSIELVMLLLLPSIFPSNKQINFSKGFLGPYCGTVVKNPPAKARDMGSIPGLERSPEEGNGKPLQYSCLGYSTDRGAWRVRVHGVTKSRILLSDWTELNAVCVFDQTRELRVVSSIKVL